MAMMGFLFRLLGIGLATHALAGMTVSAGTRKRTVDDAVNETGPADDALDLVRMDDDGGWQMPGAMPPAAQRRC